MSKHKPPPIEAHSLDCHACGCGCGLAYIELIDKDGRVFARAGLDTDLALKLADALVGVVENAGAGESEVVH